MNNFTAKRIFAGMTMVLSLLAASPADAARYAYASGAAQGDLAVTMRAGETKKIMLDFMNYGRYSWRGGGKNPTVLYASGPFGRKSVFQSPAWASYKQAARLREALVKPDQSGSVELSLKAPAKTGTYTESFQLFVVGASWIRNSTAKIRITVIPSDAPLPEPRVSAKSWIVMDAETGEEVAAHDADAHRSIASITKLMTVMLAREMGVDDGRMVAITRQDEVGGGRLRVPVGTKVSAKDLIASALVGSANNAANALARATGLTRGEFVSRMNESASSIGMMGATFADPTGIEVGNIASARDVARMSIKAFSDPVILSMTGAETYTVAAVTNKSYPHPIANTNKLIHDRDVEVVAGKTGFIYEAGYTLTTRLHQDGKKDLLVVVLGSDTKNLSFKEAKTLAEWAWSQPLSASQKVTTR